MAVGKTVFPALAPLAGVRLGSTQAGIKQAGRRDLLIMELAPGSTVAGVFTRNAFCAAPVRVARGHLAGWDAAAGEPRYWLINTGNANAGTGQQGMDDARASCARLAELAQVSPNAVLPFSTGVIGEPLPMEALLDGLPDAFAALDAGTDAWRQGGDAILTTDTRPKGASRVINVDGQAVTVNGIAKGSGMIRPDMATMLAFVVTDAAMETSLLNRVLAETVERSFNRITVDSDTSTNDACMLAATGQGAAIVDGPMLEKFKQALLEVMLELAQAIVRDAEGATKFVTLQVEQASSSREALDVAFTVAHSPLVKTALYACDANWGRILAAIGRAPLAGFDVDRVAIDLDEVRIVEQGSRAQAYTETAGSAVMARDEITIRIQLGRGQAQACVWTSDLSHDYVSINADYRS